MEINLKTEDFMDTVLKNEGVVLCDFWATWCGPCMMLAPVIEEIANELDGKVTVCKINVDEEPKLAIEYDVSSIPTLIIFKNGEVVNTLVGVQPKEKIIEELGV